MAKVTGRGWYCVCPSSTFQVNTRDIVMCRSNTPPVKGLRFRTMKEAKAEKARWERELGASTTGHYVVAYVELEPGREWE